MSLFYKKIVAYYNTCYTSFFWVENGSPFSPYPQYSSLWTCLTRSTFQCNITRFKWKYICTSMGNTISWLYSFRMPCTMASLSTNSQTIFMLLNWRSNIIANMLWPLLGMWKMTKVRKGAKIKTICNSSSWVWSKQIQNQIKWIRDFQIGYVKF